MRQFSNLRLCKEESLAASHLLETVPKTGDDRESLGTPAKKAALARGCTAQQKKYSQGHRTTRVWCQGGMRLAGVSLHQLCKCLTTMLHTWNQSNTVCQL